LPFALRARVIKNITLFKIVPDNFIEPATLGLEGRCSIQMSYRRRLVTCPSCQGRITPGVLPFALRARVIKNITLFKIVPDTFIKTDQCL
ncbi:MAG TPA: hypothetical protein VIQ81_00675, partial [Gammaproteobacteria bacterium]